MDDDAGEITGVVEFVRDITERKKLKEELSVREEQYRKIFTNAPVGMELKNADGIIINVNDKLGDITGHEREGLIGSNFIEKIVPEGLEEKAKRDFCRIMSGEDMEQTLHSKKKTGEKYYLKLKETKLQLPDDEEGLEYLSYHDGLTGLCNRTYLREEARRLDTAR